MHRITDSPHHVAAAFNGVNDSTSFIAPGTGIAPDNPAAALADADVDQGR